MQRDSDRILDEYLVSAASAGDRGAWVRLVVRWQPRLLRHAWRILGEADRARDIVQESWLEILRGLSRLDDVAAFPAWAFRIVTRRCQKWFRGADRDRQLAAAQIVDSEPQTINSVESELVADLRQVRAALQLLPGTQRSCLALFYLENLSVAEIAVALDVPPGTVKTRLMHARRKLRADLEGAAK